MTTPHQGIRRLRAGPHIGTVEVRLAAEFMERFSRAWSDDEIRSSWREICGWSSFRDSAGGPAGDDPDHAVAWHWLAGVAHVAKRNDDVMLPSQILGCALSWDRQAWQYAEVRDFAAVVQLPTADRDVKIRLAAIALPCLLALCADLKVMSGRAGPYTARGLALYAVKIILSYNEGYSPPASRELDLVVTPELAALARDVWAARVSHARWT